MLLYSAEYRMSTAIVLCDDAYSQMTNDSKQMTQQSYDVKSKGQILLIPLALSQRDFIQVFIFQITLLPC